MAKVTTTTKQLLAHFIESARYIFAIKRRCQPTMSRLLVIRAHVLAHFFDRQNDLIGRNLRTNTRQCHIGSRNRKVRKHRIALDTRHFDEPSNGVANEPHAILYRQNRTMDDVFGRSVVQMDDCRRRHCRTNADFGLATERRPRRRYIVVEYHPDKCRHEQRFDNLAFQLFRVFALFGE